MNRFWLVLGGVFALPTSVFAAEEGAAMAGGLGILGAPAVGLCIALAVIAAATAQGRIATAYMEGASRNPGADKVMRTPLILSLIFVETLVLFTVLICLMLVGKL
ncbi:MAG: ATP synthase F0 subunit C [Bdellovibrionales bacterium]|nr:ATP synthase F0 subunit C [Bdellovibrionales bacterium]MCB0418971.1 ATP synthase F0 subunit C [Bdellovibrionales bacterium]MCB9253372.1 ATP synthase F0 subunit C [Pseudobdellovibrionaceae bacterium]